MGSRAFLDTFLVAFESTRKIMVMAPIAAWRCCITLNLDWVSMGVDKQRKAL